MLCGGLTCLACHAKVDRDKVVLATVHRLSVDILRLHRLALDDTKAIRRAVRDKAKLLAFSSKVFRA